jgi:hypothetical protein
MKDAHCEAGFVVGLPFAAEGLYDFGAPVKMTSRFDTSATHYLLVNESYS